MKVALAQINPCLGDFAGNGKKILDFCEKAAARNSDLVVFPESSLMGYHPVDLLERPVIVKKQMQELTKISQKIPKGISVLVGAITPNTKKTGKPFLNSAVLLVKGKKPRVFSKELLPTYDVFDEARFIEPGDLSKNTFSFKGQKVLVTICEDIWAWPNSHHGKRSIYKKNPIKKLKKKDVDIVVNLSASPFEVGKHKSREAVVKETSKYFSAPMVYVNMVGAQDEVIYEGASFAVDSQQKLIKTCESFKEDIQIVDLLTKNKTIKNKKVSAEELQRQGLVLGIKDFVHKTGFEKVHLGLSGGIDSALVACLAVDALGPMNVKAISMPSQHTSDLSKQLSRELADNLGIELKEVSIEEAYQAFENAFDKLHGKIELGLVHENIQARIRAGLLMSESNQNSSLLLNTSNKSEFATGYSTLYGDLCGGLCPIGDLLKTEVYALARHYNKEYELIPDKIITRAPSAELKPNQTDQDSLPAYEDLDQSIINIVEEFKAPASSVGQDLIGRLMRSEFKRWQAPPILKVSAHAFGRGRRYPIAHKARY